MISNIEIVNIRKSGTIGAEVGESLVEMALNSGKCCSVGISWSVKLENSLLNC
jgi:hypothetical protein